MMFCSVVCNDPPAGGDGAAEDGAAETSDPYGTSTTRSNTEGTDTATASGPGGMDEVTAMGPTDDSLGPESTDPEGADDRTTGTPLTCAFDIGDLGTLASGIAATECPVDAFERVTLRFTERPEPLDLDLYLPTGTTGPLPTVIGIHGGGWRNGSRSDVRQALGLVCRGFALANIDYRLSGVATFPAQIHDVKAAVRFLRANAAEHGLDPERFYAFGSSSGGHLAALVGTSYGVAELEDLRQGNPDESSAVQGIVDWYGPTDLPAMDGDADVQGCNGPTHSAPDSPESELLGCNLATANCAMAATAASPIEYIDEADPPFLILHGSNDCTVARGQSLRLVQALTSAGVCAQFKTVDGALHGGPEWLGVGPQDEMGEFLQGLSP